MIDNLFPLFQNFGSSTYVKTFIAGGVLSSLTAVFAVYFDSLTKKRLEKTDFCNSKYNLFCTINLNKYLTLLNLCVRTFTFTIILSILFFFIFGWGGGSLNNFYKPGNKDFFTCILIIFILFIVNFIFYFIVISISYKKNKLERFPSVGSVLYTILFEYGITNNFHYDKGDLKNTNKEFIKNMKMKNDIIKMKNEEKINYLDKQTIKEKSRILHLLSAKERAKIFNNVDQKKTILYLSLISPEDKSKTIYYMN